MLNLNVSNFFWIFFILDEKMSLPLEFTLSGTIPTSNIKFNVQFIYNDSTKQIQLGYTQNFGQQALFNLTNLPSFLQSNHELYLGDIYTPQLRLGNNYFYIEEVSPRSSTYNLVSTPNPKCFSFSPTVPGTLEVTPYNFPVSNTLVISGTVTPITVVSPTQCTETCTNCGWEVCPENFSCVSGQCATQLPINSAFGIRVKSSNQTQVYTYSIVGNSLVIHLVPTTQISAVIETSDIFKERWFYADYFPGQNQLIVGQNYPLYTFINSTKYYISNPVGVPGTIVTYQLKPSMSSSDRVLTFKPTSPANWGSFTVTPSQFLNLALPNNTNATIALWQNASVLGTPAVIVAPNIGQVAKDTVGPVIPPCKSNSECTEGRVCDTKTGKCHICTANSQCSTGQICSVGKCIAAPNTCTTNSDCTGGQACVGGQCKPCASSAQCSSGQICVSGKCQAPMCTSNSQCVGGQVCSNGLCQACTASSQCTGGQVCQNGVCTNPPSTPFWKTWWFWLIIGIFLLIIVAVVAYLIFGRKKKVSAQESLASSSSKYKET